MSINFRALADGQYVEPEATATEGAPPTCSYCGASDFETEDTGRGTRARCKACNGTMTSSGTGYWQPELIGAPKNHPKQNADPNSGGVGGVWAPVLRLEDLRDARTASAEPRFADSIALMRYLRTDDEHRDLDSHHPGWDHAVLHAYGPQGDHAEPIGRLEFSAGPDQVRVHETRVHQDHRRQGIGTALNDTLTAMFPRHEIDRGPATADGEAFRQSLGAADWCRHRHAEHCWLPNNKTNGSVALYIPQDRGRCPWTLASQQQINCPVSEPGPMAGMTMKGDKKKSTKSPPLKRGLGKTHDPKTCPVCRMRNLGPVKHQAAPVPSPFPNPNGGTSWYHGTNFHPDEDVEYQDQHTHWTPPQHGLDGHPVGAGTEHFHGDPGGQLKTPDRTPWKTGGYAEHHWNTDLGVHYTSDHATAADTFAGSGSHHTSRVAHASIHMANPAIYEDEHQLGAHAINWARSIGHRFLPESRRAHDHFTDGDDHLVDKHDPAAYAHVGDHVLPHDTETREGISDIDRDGADPKRHDVEHMDYYLSSHPAREEITEGFRNHLREQGHDSIIYGNEKEGPHKHLCAIAFPETHTHIHKWEWQNPESEHHVPQQKRAEDWDQHHLLDADPRYWPKSAARGGVLDGGDASFHFSPGEGVHHHELALNHGANEVGKLAWGTDGDISGVDTHHKYQRQGIATALYTKAHELAHQHGIEAPSGSVFQTPAGRGFRQHFDGMGERPDVSHIPTQVHRGKGEGDTDLIEHLVEHHYPTSEDMVRDWDQPTAERVHENVRRHDRCGWQTQASRDPELQMHMLATWADVRNKAKRIRAEGGVSIVVASGDGVGGHVQGDTGVYESILNYAPGSFRVANWQCGCAWAAYAWNRSPAYRRFEGRMCSHVLALQFEAQARGMFGRKIEEDTVSPTWLRDKVRQRYDRDTGVHDLVHASRQDPWDPDGVLPSDHGLDLARPPVYAFVVTALSEGEDPAAAMAPLLGAGMAHAAALGLLREAMADQGSLPAVEVTAGRTEALRASDSSDRVNPVSAAPHEASSVPRASGEDDDAPTHAGLVLKAQDTGRVLMLQRSHKDESDPARGTWEFPGGGIEDHDSSSLHAAAREFAEEIGQRVPHGGTLQHVWRSGPYVGHVLVVPSEDHITLHDGRVVPNPDDPDGDDAEQAAWWDPDHARKNPALREECKSSPWNKIKEASRGKSAAQDLRSAAQEGAGAGAVVVGSGAAPANPRVADFSAHDPLGDFTPDPPAQSPNTIPGEQENPGSTGFATAADPPAFDAADARTMRMPEMSSYGAAQPDLWDSAVALHVAAHGELHDQPEGALPSTDGADDDGWSTDVDPANQHIDVLHTLAPQQDPRDGMKSEIDPTEDMAPNQVHASVQDIVAAFQATAGAKALSVPGGKGGAGPSDMDIAAAARAHVAKTALKDFSFTEQQELIGEGAHDGTRARNLGDLRIEGTHYEALARALDEHDLMTDTEALFV